MNPAILGVLVKPHSAAAPSSTGPLDQEDGFAILTETGDTLAWESI